jgi:hypothetical protein
MHPSQSNCFRNLLVFFFIFLEEYNIDFMQLLIFSEGEIWDFWMICLFRKFSNFSDKPQILVHKIQIKSEFVNQDIKLSQ